MARAINATKRIRRERENKKVRIFMNLVKWKSDKKKCKHSACVRTPSPLWFRQQFLLRYFSIEIARYNYDINGVIFIEHFAVPRISLLSLRLIRIKFKLWIFRKIEQNEKSKKLLAFLSIQMENEKEKKVETETKTFNSFGTSKFRDCRHCKLVLF